MTTIIDHGYKFTQRIDSSVVVESPRGITIDLFTIIDGSALADAVVDWIAEWGPRDRYCATCNEPEFSGYAANCRAHTPDNMIEA